MRVLVSAVLLLGGISLAGAAEWQLTTANANSAHPTWCGNNIVFHSDRESGVFQIWGIGEAGESRAWRLTNQPWRTFTEPSWQCGERFVAFHGLHGAGPDTIWIVYDIGPPTFVPIPVTRGNGDDRSACYGPVQPGPNRIAFHSDRWSHDDVYGMPEGGEARSVTRLTTNPAEDRYPAVSPDGQWIAFTGSVDGRSDIYIASRHGGWHRVTKSGTASQPSWDARSGRCAGGGISG